MKLSGLLLLILIYTHSVSGQNLIGYSSDQIIKYMDKNQSDLVLETNFRNDHYKYLKFTDASQDSKTVLFFISEKNKCTSVRIIYDPGYKTAAIEELDSLYKRINENEWYDESGRREATISLLVEDWFLTVSIKPK